MRNGPVPDESPVFVDRSGIRRRWFVVFGVTGTGLLAMSVVMLIAGFLGTTPGRLPGLPVPPGQVARQAEGGGGPATATRSKVPVAQPAASAGATPPPGAAPLPAPAARPSPTASASPSPTRHGNGNGPPHPRKK
jgi:hypothetical protein